MHLKFQGGATVSPETQVIYRSVDRVKGELEQYCEVVPPVSLFASPYVFMVKDTNAMAHFGVEAFTDLPKAELICELVAGSGLQTGTARAKPHERRRTLGRYVERGATRCEEPCLALPAYGCGPCRADQPYPPRH